MTDLRSHMAAHAGSNRLRSELDFLFEAERRMKWLDYIEVWKEKGSDLASRVAEAGFVAYWKDVTTVDLESAGFCVVRAVIPGMQPLDSDHRWRYLGGDRVIRVARSVGRHNFTVDDYNGEPHPFP